MFIKLYDKVLKIIKENYKFFLTLIILFLILTYQLPYYIEAPGGILDVSTRVEVEGANEINGSFNLAYVSEFKATIPTIIFAYFNDDWNILKQEEVVQNETLEQIDYRNHLLLEEANNNAVIVGFNKALEPVEVTNRKINIIYIHQQANTNLEVKDQIIEVNGNVVTSKEHLYELLEDCDGKINFKVRNDDTIYERYAYKSNIEN